MVWRGGASGLAAFRAALLLGESSGQEMAELAARERLFHHDGLVHSGTDDAQKIGLFFSSTARRAGSHDTVFLVPWVVSEQTGWQGKGVTPAMHRSARGLSAIQIAYIPPPESYRV